MLREFKHSQNRLPNSTLSSHHRKGYEEKNYLPDRKIINHFELQNMVEINFKSMLMCSVYSFSEAGNPSHNSH